MRERGRDKDISIKIKYILTVVRNNKIHTARQMPKANLTKILQP